MRPATLKEAIERIVASQPREMALPEFLDTFYLSKGDDARLRAIADEPPLSGDERLDALAGAIAHYLAQQYELESVPPWVFAPSRFLREPWHTTSFEGASIREYLTFASPAEFRCRNIFTDECPLDRARRVAA